MSAYIDDGYTEHACIAPEPGLTPALRFTFRPMLVTELARFSRQTARASEEDVRIEVATWLSEKIIDWDLRDSTGRRVPVRAAGDEPWSNLLRLKPPVFVKLWRIVCCECRPHAPNLEADSKNCNAGCGCGCNTPPSPAEAATTVSVTSTTMPPDDD